jgi:hypothetical protein
MVPTLFGIMLVAFVIIQFAPGGPVERVIAQLSGTECPPPPASAAAPAARRASARPRRRTAAASFAIAARKASTRNSSEARAAVRLRQAGARALRHDDDELSHLRLRRELFSRRAGPAADQGKAARLGVARTVADPHRLWRLGAAGHRQGGARRLQVRCVDVGRHHRRLCHPELPVRHPARRHVRRRLVLQLVPAARPHLRQLRSARLVAADPRLRLASGAAADRARRQLLRHHDAAHQELVPRRDQEAVCRHRPRQGACPSAGCSTATCSATPC